MKKKETIIVCVLFLLALAYYGYNFLKNKNASYVIVHDLNANKIVDRINLNKDGYYSYDGAYGKFNLEVSNKSIRAVDVECPNHNCEKMGAISADHPLFGGIICVPNGFEVVLDE